MVEVTGQDALVTRHSRAQPLQGGRAWVGLSQFIPSSSSSLYLAPAPTKLLVTSC